ncbi:MAG: hypothetical protein JO179_13490 [Solirubrobacterales bacterium]|nr:hypothetical protein [Solirubrobacterales bacterium]
MRGGAIPLLAWGTLLLVLYAGHWIWDAKPVASIETAVAMLIIYAGGVALWLARRESIRRGPPPARPKVEAAPSMSLGAAVAGLSVGTILFGLAWAQFLVYFGAGVLLLSLGRVWVELRAEHASRRAALEEEDAGQR